LAAPHQDPEPPGRRHGLSEAEARQKQLLQEEVLRLLPRTLSDEERAVHFQAFATRYFRCIRAREIADDLILTHGFMASSSPTSRMRP